MANGKTSLRYIYFPSVAGSQTSETTDHLMYLLPFPTTLSIHNNPENAVITKTFTPKDLNVSTSIIDSNILSPGYNKYLIEDYIANGIFSNTAITTSTGVAGVAASPSNYEIWTEYQIFNTNNTWESFVVEARPFYRDTSVYWIETTLTDGTIFELQHYSVNSGTTVQWSINWDTFEPLNPVVDSNGAPWLVNIVPDNAGTTATVYLSLPRVNFHSLEIRTTAATNLGSIAWDPLVGTDDLRPVTVLIDMTDDIYLVTSKFVYKITDIHRINEGPFLTELTTLSTVSLGGDWFTGAAYDISDDTILLALDRGELSTKLLKVDPFTGMELTNGTISNIQTTFGLINNITLMQHYKVGANNEPGYVGNLFGNTHQIELLQDASTTAFTDWDPPTTLGTLTDSRKIGVNYDIHEVDGVIWFIDVLCL